MKFFETKIIVLAAILAAFGCSKNLLTDLGSRSSDDALLEDAQKAVNAQQYQSAIDIITTKVSAGGQTKVLAKEILASGYAGACGLNFIDFVTSLSSSTGLSAFKLVSAPFVGRPVNAPFCLQSLNVFRKHRAKRKSDN